MSGEYASQRRENEPTDVFIVHSSHTAVPNWIALRGDISLGARNLAHVILVKATGPLLPTRESLAELLGVDVRTIAGWLNELRSAHVMRTYRAGRRNFFIVSDSGLTPTHDPTISDPTISDPTISDPTISDPTISDRGIMGWGYDRTRFLSQQNAVNSGFSQNPISDPPVGVVGDQQSQESDPTSTNRAPLKTALARWLKRAGMNAAREFDDPALDYAVYREFVEYKRSLGWEWRQIVSTLREAPLESADDQADDEPANEPADELAQRDSTSMALARRFEADKAEAAARAAGLLGGEK